MTRFEPPAAVRLVRNGTTGRPPAPPFGLPAWDAGAPALAVALDLGEGATAADVFARLPNPAVLVPGALVIVLGEGEGDARLLGRLFRGRPKVPRGARGSALLARGYTRIGGDDDDLVWGFAPG